MADLISRAAAIAEVEEYLQELDSCISEPDLKLDGYRNGLQVAIQELKALPAVDAAPVIHGRPVCINPLDPDAKICTWKCSSLCSACGDYVAVSWKHCQNCGAKLDADQGIAFADQSGAEYADNPTV